MSPLRELEEAGVIKLDPPKPLEPIIHSLKSLPPPGLTTKPPGVVGAPGLPVGAQGLPVLPATSAVGVQAATIVQQAETADAMSPAVIPPEVDVSETEVSEIVDNKDGSFSVSFKGPNDEMQHIQILRPDGMKGDMMLELTNVAAARRRAARSVGGVGGLGIPGNKTNECDICGKVLSSSTNLIRHKMYHSTERPYVCEVCNKGFKDVSNLKKHTQIHKRIYPCFLCKKSFLRKSLLAIHLKRHEARTTFVKTGNTSKEVTMRTFVDQDGSRIEEMSMTALQGQTFEYKHRIMKADGNNVNIKNENESFSGDASLNDTVNASNADMSLVTDEDGKVITSTPKQPMFTVTLGGLRETPVPEKGKAFAANGDSLVEDGEGVADVKIPPLPEDFVKLYQCGHCGKRTVQRGNMMRHLIHHLKDKPFACDECPKQFVDKGELVKHKKTHTKPYRCHQCNGAFAHNVQLIKHLQSDCLGDVENLNYTVLEDGKTYKCDICHIEMKRLGNMIKHVSTHSYDSRRGIARLTFTDTTKQETVDSKPKPPNALYYFDAAEQAFFCSICCKMFKQRANAHRHVRIHIDDKPFYSTKESLRRHTEPQRKPHNCDMCKLSFTHKTQLEAHRRRCKKIYSKNIKAEKGEECENAHFGKMPNGRFYCKYCDIKLHNEYKIRSHIRRHTDNKPFECQICNKCFSDSYMLLKHKKAHKKTILDRQKYQKHSAPSGNDELEEDEYGSIVGDNGREFLCSICKAPFSRAVIRMNHEKKCKDESKILMRLPSGKGFKCKICNKVATLKHNLMVHIRKHSDIVKVDSSGQITLLADFEGSVTKKPVVIKKVRSRGPRQQSLASQMREDLASDEDIDTLEMECHDANEKAEDKEPEDLEELYGKYMRQVHDGWACTICRRKFTDRETILRHLQSGTCFDNSAADSCSLDSSSVTQTAGDISEETSLPAASEVIQDVLSEEQEGGHSADSATINMPKVVLTDVLETTTKAATEEEINNVTESIDDADAGKIKEVGTTPTKNTYDQTSTKTPKAAHSIKKEQPKSLKRKISEINIKTENEQEFTPSRRTSRAQKIPSRFLE